MERLRLPLLLHSQHTRKNSRGSPRKFESLSIPTQSSLQLTCMLHSLRHSCALILTVCLYRTLDCCSRCLRFTLAWCWAITTAASQPQEEVGRVGTYEEAKVLVLHRKPWHDYEGTRTDAPLTLHHHQPINPILDVRVLFPPVCIVRCRC